MPLLTELFHGRSGQDVFYDLAVNVGEAEVTALVAEDQFFVIETQKMQDRGLEIVDGNFIPNDGKAQFICFAISNSVLHTPAGEKDREAIGVMIPAQNFAGGRPAFAKWRAPKLTAP